MTPPQDISHRHSLAAYDRRAGAARISREEAALREIGRTDFARGAAPALLVIFLLTMLSVGAVQQMYELRQQRGGRDGAGPHGLAIFRAIPESLRAFMKAPGPILDRALAATDSLHLNIRRYEELLEDQSIVSLALLPPAQSLLTGRLGAGNEQAYCGRNGWLFYRPDIDYLTGQGFLEAGQRRRRALSGDRWTPAPQPDSIKAILQFRDQLRARGIGLVLMPTPVKPMVHPEKFSGAFRSGQGPLQNPSFAKWKADLAAQGVLVFDVAQALVDAQDAGRHPQYLETDTHWRPEAVELAAGRLVEFIQTHAPLPPAPPAEWRAERVQVANLGDIAVMLKLPANQDLFRNQRVAVRQVLTARGELWRPAAAADVLVLGDSFSNIYSLEPMGWGESAGFVEQLSFAWRRPLDALLRNDDGAHATRQLLSRQLARGIDRLAGKRLVIWQFAIRELAHGDWKILPLDLGRAATRNFYAPEPGATLIVTGTIEATSAVPKPGSVPYKDHIMALQLTDLKIEGPRRNRAEGDALVYHWSMQDNNWSQAARLRPGQRVRLRLAPWADVSDKFERINRSELDDPQLQLEEPCWGELLPQ